MSERKKEALVPIMVRLPEFLRSLVAEEAKKAGRSMNKEIIARLQGSFARDVTREEREEIRAMYESIDRRLKDIEDFQAGQKVVIDARKS